MSRHPTSRFSCRLASIGVGLAILSCPVMAQDMSQPLESIDDYPKDPKPRSWSEVSERIRSSSEPYLDKLYMQTEFQIETANYKAGRHRVEPGDVIIWFKAKPVRDAVLTSNPKGLGGGTKGTTLGSIVDQSGQYFCAQNANPVFSRYFPFCYRDTNDDGQFDESYEFIERNPGTPRLISDFRKVRSGNFVSYRIEKSEKEYLISIRYLRGHSGNISDQGILTSGGVKFEMVVSHCDGKVVQRRPIAVKLNALGRGWLDRYDGTSIVVDQVNFDGDARVQVMTAADQDHQNYIAPRLTREAVLTTLQRHWDNLADAEMPNSAAYAPGLAPAEQLKTPTSCSLKLLP